MKNNCVIEQDNFQKEPFSLVIFGGAGDLSKRKLIPAINHLFRSGKIKSTFNVIGFGLPEMNDEEYREFVKNSLEEFSNIKECEIDGFLDLFTYVSSGFDNAEGYVRLMTKIGKITPQTSDNMQEVIFYLAVPPSFSADIIQNLGQCNVCQIDVRSKIIMEKPFGRDKKTAKELNDIVHSVFDESQIYRIDHYLGKETVQNILFFRFGNSIFEQLWNRNNIDHIQILVSEEIGIEHRGKFYEQAGVIRDIVQNHLLQLIALVAMEPPVGFEADAIRDEKVKVFQTIRKMNKDYIEKNTVRGQYGPGLTRDSGIKGYREEENVDKDSNTPTFVAVKLFIDNWRWADVPFYIRAGKRLKKKTTEIYIEFKHPPLKLFGDECDDMKPNGIIFSIQPEEEISINLSVKLPGMGNHPYNEKMVFNYSKIFNAKPLPAYERLLIDCMKGDLTLFARQDGIEEMWSVVDPIIREWEENPEKQYPNYFAGSWGPEKAKHLIHKDNRRWRFEDE